MVYPERQPRTSIVLHIAAQELHDAGISILGSAAMRESRDLGENLKGQQMTWPKNISSMQNTFFDK